MNSLKKIFSAKAVSLIFVFLIDYTFSQTQIAILYSVYTETKSENHKRVLEEITSWELFLMESKIPYKVIYDDDLESGIEDEFDILILPSVDYISAEEIESIKLFLSNGKSIINMGSKLYDNLTDENNFTNLQTIFNLNNFNLVDLSTYNVQHSLNLNRINKFNPDEAGLLHISNKNGIMYHSLSKDDKNVCGYLIADEDRNLSSSICFGENLNAKYLWTGFGFNDLVGGNNEFTNFKNLILNTLHWMKDETDVFVDLQYGNDKEPALLVLENNNALEPELIDVLNKNSFNLHLLINYQLKIPAFVSERLKNESVILDLTNLDMNNFTKEKLNEIISKFNRENVEEISSVFINESIMTKEYLNTFQEMGIKNIFINSNINGVVKIVDDETIIIPISKSNKNNMGNGFSSLYANPKFNCKENFEDKFIAEFNLKQKKSKKFVPINEFRSWWITKENLFAKISKSSEDQIEVFVTNDNPNEMTDIPVYIKLPKDFAANNLNVKSNGKDLTYYNNSMRDEIIVIIDRLFAKSNKKILVNHNLE